MEESKEIQGFYKIFRAVVYISLLMEFFAYALEPEQLDFLGGLITDIHGRIKRWMIYHDGNLVWSKIATILLICITCIGTRTRNIWSSMHADRSYILWSADSLLQYCLSGSSVIGWTQGSTPSL